MAPLTSPEERGWPVNVLVTASVVLTVLIALLLTQMDALLERQPMLPTPIAQLSGEQATPVSPTPLPTQTATSPPTETATVAATPDLPTAVPVQQAQCGTVPADWVSYTVRPGDTYFRLSVNSGATINEIVQANCLDSNLLVAGMDIYLPERPPQRDTCGPPGDWIRYVIQRGDTLYSLAQRYETSVYAIMQANCLSSTYLEAEKRIYLPPPPATATPLPSNTPPPTNTPAPPTDTPAPPTARPTVAPSPLPTSTITPRPSATPLPSSTPRPSATAVATTPPGVTSTATHTPTASPISPTATPSATASPTPSATATLISSPTATPSSTSTVSPPTTTTTPSPTATSPPTATSSPTASPTATDTPLPTATATPTPSPTP